MISSASAFLVNVSQAISAKPHPETDQCAFVPEVTGSLSCNFVPDFRFSPMYRYQTADVHLYSIYVPVSIACNIPLVHSLAMKQIVVGFDGTCRLPKSRPTNRNRVVIHEKCKKTPLPLFVFSHPHLSTSFAQTTTRAIYT